MAAHPTFHRGYPRTSTIPGQRTLAYFAAAFFTLTLLTDLAYVQTMILMWRDFSAWLLFAGMVAGGLSALLWLAGLALRRNRPVWAATGVDVLVLVAAFLNNLVHAGDGWTSIVPWGIGLSAVTCVLMAVSAALRRRAFHDPVDA